MRHDYRGDAAVQFVECFFGARCAGDCAGFGLVAEEQVGLFQRIPEGVTKDIYNERIGTRDRDLRSVCLCNVDCFANRRLTRFGLAKT